jgi:DNA-binding CsgD family transcriptional regulator
MFKERLAAFHRAVRLVHSCRRGADLSGHLLSAMREIIPADIVLADWNGCRLHGVRTAYNPPGAISREVNEAVHLHLKDNPLYGKRKREACSISDHLDRAAWHRTALYSEGYGKAGQEDGLAIDLDFADGCRLSLCATRWRRGFGKIERLQLTLLREHVDDAYRRLVATEGHGCWLDVREDGSLTRAPDEETGKLLRRYFGWDASRGGMALPDDLSRWAREFFRLLVEPGRAISSSARFGTGRLVLDARIVLSAKASGEAQIFIAERGCPSESLTAREREVLGWLGEGKTNAEIAILLGILPGTVKRHLENLYQKLGVENRHAAARWAERPG